MRMESDCQKTLKSIFLRKRHFWLIKSTSEQLARQQTAYNTPRVTHFRRLAGPRVAYSSHCVRCERRRAHVALSSSCPLARHGMF